MDLFRRAVLALCFVAFLLIASLSFRAGLPGVAFLVAGFVVFSSGFLVFVRDPSDPTGRADEASALTEDSRRSVPAEIEKTVSSINHEIANILSPVDFYLRKAESACENEEVAKALSIVAQRFKALDSLCKELRSFYKVPSLALSNVDLGGVVDSALTDLARTTGDEWVSPNTSGLDVSVLADRQQLKQILSHIVRNGWEAMDGCPEKTWSIGASPEDGWAIVRITDNGSGIPHNLQKRLFEPFFTTKGGCGTGLGLAIAKKLTEAHGAEIAIDSAPDKGTTVTLRWPMGS